MFMLLFHAHLLVAIILHFFTTVMTGIEFMHVVRFLTHIAHSIKSLSRDQILRIVVA